MIVILPAVHCRVHRNTLLHQCRIKSTDMMRLRCITRDKGTTPISLYDIGHMAA